MAEISLRDYFAKLEQLLNATAADEVIHHCRHILQYYPKNVTVYRYLGRALLINGRWDEAMAALRRVLSVIPDDYHAHLGLSEIYDHKQQPDEAIWHLERAFEHNPNSRELLEGLRTLYRRYRDVEQVKIQLTAAAVARQAERNQAFEQAIETLRDALVRQPERVDLRALLVHALWESGDHVEAAETALDVLESLPDCLEANRILTALWLEEDRPSDAQRYLNRIEAIDPYLAVELAQGQAAPDDAFRLEELDYKRTSQSEMAGERPAWLENISSDTVPEATESSDADWSHFMSSMLAGSLNHESSPEGEVAEAADELFGEDWMEEQMAASSSIEDEIPDEFAALAPPAEQRDEIPQLFDDSGSSSPFEPDPMTWLRENGMELTEEPAQNGLQHDEVDVSKRETDSLAWMQDDEYADQTRARPQPSADAFSWMQEFDVELVQDQPEPEAIAAEEPVQAEETPAWLDDQGSLEEALGIEQLTGADQSEALDWLNQSTETEMSEEPEAASSPDAEQAPYEPDSIDLEMPDLFSDVAAVESQETESISTNEPQGVPGPRRGLTAMLNEANFDWMKNEESQEDVMSEAVMDEWLAHFGASPSKAAAATQDPEWLNELDTVMNENDNKQNNSDETPSWLSGTGENEAPQTPEEEEALAWLNQTAPDAEPAEMPDWMAALEPSDANMAPEESEEEQPPIAEDFDWSATQVTPIDAPVEPADVPDWLTELAPTSTYEVGSGFLSEQPEQAEASDSQFEWLSEQAASPEGTPSNQDDYTWLDEAEIEAEAEDAALEDQLPAEEASPEWLSEIAAEEPVPVQDAAVAAELPDESWYDELEIEAEAAEDQEEAQIPSAAPDWLSGLQIGKPSDTEAEPAGVSATSFDWLDDVEDEAPIETAAQLGEPAGADLPDWLTELEISQAGEPEAEVADADVPSWVNQDVGQLETEIPAETQDYTWLNELPQEEAATTVVPLPADTGDYTWLSELQSDEELVESEATEQESESPEPVTAESGEFDWLNEINPEPEAAIEPAAAEVSDAGWLEELAGENEVELEAIIAQTDDELVTAEEEESAWAAVSEAESEIAAEIGEPEWLSEVSPEAEEPPAAAAIGEPEWLAELDSEEDAEALPAEEDAVPEFELEAEAVDEEAVPSYMLQDTADDEDEYWLNDEQESAPEPVGETSWDELMSESEGETVLATNGFEVEEEGYEPAPASNAPDWLNAMVPGLDMNYETLEEEPAETEAASEVLDEDSEEAREYDWVEEIVEEESRQPAQRRFIFSRAPAWLRRSSEPAKRDDELPDWPSDEPEWQR